MSAEQNPNLIPCPDCGHLISKKNPAACPNCGSVKQWKKEGAKQGILFGCGWLGLAFIILILIIYAAFS